MTSTDDSAPAVAASSPRASVTRGSRPWAARYATILAVTDLAVVSAAVVGAQILRFGVDLGAGAMVLNADELSLAYAGISIVLIVAWMVSLGAFRSRGARVVGAGAAEYRLVVQATLWLFGLSAIVLFLFKIDIARAYVLVALPLGLIGLLLGRWGWRQWLVQRRRHGEYSYRVVLAGSLDSVVRVARDLASSPASGYLVAAAAAPGAGLQRLPGTMVPVADTLDHLPELMAAHGADTLIVTSSDQLPASRVRELSWALEPGRQHMVVAPSLTDVGGPRIHTRPVAGLPLMHVETPTFQGPQLFLKRLFDIVGASLLLVLLSPLLLGLAIAVKASSPGPVLFRQERIGRQGTSFRMLKFRSMVEDAEDRLGGLLDEERDAGNSVLFKLKDDPRVTSVGRFLRRFSLDELPQLFNVFIGQMSLVGPRPPLPREVETYEDHVRRRFLVKPGVTGLWQVGGRSALSWEDSVRLDLYYVENWSLTGDLVILWRTAKAVFSRHGAY